MKYPIRFPALAVCVGGVLLSGLMAATPASAQAQNPAPALPAAIAQSVPVAKVNGVVIPPQRADLVMRERVQGGQKDSEQLRAAVRDELINREIITQAAEKSGIIRSAELQNELDLVRQTVIVQGFLRDYVRNHPVTDAEVQKEYDRAKSERGDKEYRVRHILVTTEEEAKKLIGELKKGAKFEDLAKKSTTDQGTKANGGDLGWQAAGGALVPEFSQAMAKLAKGKFTEVPVKTQFGYHVIKTEDVRNMEFPPLAQVKSRVIQGIQAERVAKLIAELRSKAKIE